MSSVANDSKPGEAELANMVSADDQEDPDPLERVSPHHQRPCALMNCK